MPTTPAAGPGDALLDGLTDPQRRAVTSPAGPLVVQAGAGAGKTRVLTRRIAYRVATGTATPDHVLALTFTRKAATELSSRLRQLGLRDHVACGTFHALAAAQLRRWWADRRRPAPVLLDRPARIVGALVAERPSFANVPLSEVMAMVDWARARAFDPDDAAGFDPGGRSMPVPLSELGALLRRYRDEKVRRGLVDFDDLLGQCSDAMAADPTFAAAQRWRWQHLFVDEFQDLNPLQFRLLSSWLGTGTDLCVVGDPNQAVYGWNGADPRLLASIPERWPGAEVVTLDLNHRCTPQVVAAAAAVLGAPGAGLSSSRPDGPPVRVRSWPSDDAEAAGVAAAIRSAGEAGARWSSMAVLVRTNAQAACIAEACREAGVPVRVPGQVGLLQHPAARRALDQLRARPAVPVAVAAADLAGTCPGGPLGARSAGTRSSGAGVADQDDAGVLAALADLASSAARLDPRTTVGGWLDTLAASVGFGDLTPDADAVTVCSFHRAKGLEWDAVWVCGLEAGLVPMGRAASPAALEEERRLLYVALTRASRRLHCSWAERRRFGDRPVPREPSPWLEDLEAVCAPQPLDGRDGGDQPSVEEWQRRVAAAQERLHGMRRARGAGWRQPTLPPGWAPPDPEVLDALQAWRADAARASAVPAHVVLHDTVLVALASARPGNEDDLLRIPGLGPVKASRHGAALLTLVARRARSA